MNQEIEMIRGTSEKIQIHVFDADGEPYTLASGEKLVFGVKKKPDYEECVLKKVITECTDGVCTVNIAPKDTEGLAYGKYFYDVGLLSGDNYFSVIPPNAFNLIANITKRGDAT